MSQNLAIVQMLQSQNAKYITVNDQTAAIDAKLTEEVSVEFDAGDSQAISVSDSGARQNFSFLITDTVAFTGGAPQENTLTFPDIKNGQFSVWNNARRGLLVTTAAQPNAPVVDIPSECKVLCYCDGTDVWTIATQYRSVSTYVFAPVNNKVEFIYPVERNLRLWDNTSGSATHRNQHKVRTGVNPSGTIIFDVAVDAGSIGTFTITSFGIVTWQINPAGDFVELVAGDALKITSPADVKGVGQMAVNMVLTY